MDTNEFKVLNDRTKRLETKLTHMMEVFGVNTQNNQKVDLNHPLISITKVDNMTFIKLLHKEVTIMELQDFLSNHIGSIVVVCGDEILWKIVK